MIEELETRFNNLKESIGLNNKEVVSFDSKENKVISDIKRENKNVFPDNYEF